MKTSDIKFKPEFEEILIRFELKEKFVNNVVRRIVKNCDNHFQFQNRFKEKIWSLNQEDSFGNFIDNAFAWSDTPEGHRFWADVSYFAYIHQDV